MAKRASEPQKSASASTTSSAKTPTRVPDGKMVLRVRSKEKMKLKDMEETSPRPSKKPKTAAKKKIAKIDAKKPKKPATAFFFFLYGLLEDFRKEFHEQNPDVKSMRDVGKACGEKWKTMTYEEKVQYYDIATEKRAEFDRAMADYIKSKESGEDRESEEDSEFEG
ncbi:hypothetical protein LguiA_025076 [Lonicera macranthoides]